MKKKSFSSKSAPQSATNSTTLTYRINVDVPDITSTTFAKTVLKLDPSTYESDRVAWQMLGWCKYYVVSVGLHFISTCSVMKSSGSYGVAYLADEKAVLPTSITEMRNAANQGSGREFEVKSKFRWSISNKLIRNLAEGYTPGEAQTPGIIVLGVCSTGEVAAPGTMVMTVTYHFMSPRTNIPTGAIKANIPVGGQTWLNVTPKAWPAGITPPSGTSWVFLESLINSCYPDGVTPTWVAIFLDTYGWMPLEGDTFTEMVNSANDDAEQWNAMMDGYTLKGVTSDMSYPPSELLPWPTASVYVVNIVGNNPVPVIQDTAIQPKWQTNAVQNTDEQPKWNSLAVQNVEEQPKWSTLAVQHTDEQPKWNTAAVQKISEQPKWQSAAVQLTTEQPTWQTNATQNTSDQPLWKVAAVQDVESQPKWKSDTTAFLADHSIGKDDPIFTKEKGNFFMDLASGVVSAAVVKDGDPVPVNVSIPIGGDIQGVASLPDVNVPVPSVSTGAGLSFEINAPSDKTTNPDEVLFWHMVANSIGSGAAQEAFGYFERDTTYVLRVTDYRDSGLPEVYRFRICNPDKDSPNVTLTAGLLSTGHPWGWYDVPTPFRIDVLDPTAFEAVKATKTLQFCLQD